MDREYLTIAIPTFNRNTLLDQNLRRLAGVLDYRTRLIIIDNASPTPIAQTSADTLAILQSNGIDVRVIRNRFNIGGEANILRCIECCETPYLWILGDDDLPREDALERVLGHLVRTPDIAWINFHSPGHIYSPRRDTTEYFSLLECFQSIYSWNDLLLISNNVFDARILQRQICDAHLNQMAAAPHLLALMFGLSGCQSPYRIVLSCEAVLDRVAENRDIATTYQTDLVLNGLFVLQTLPLERPLRQEVRRMICNARRLWLPTFPIFKFLCKKRAECGMREFTDFCARYTISFRYYDLPLALKDYLMFALSLVFGGQIYRFFRNRPNRTNTSQAPGRESN